MTRHDMPCPNVNYPHVRFPNAHKARKRLITTALRASLTVSEFISFAGAKMKILIGDKNFR
jgi:hypothetical protein